MEQIIKPRNLFPPSMETQNIELISVDMQYDFTKKGGASFEHRPSVQFITAELIPILREQHMKIHEIIADYRQPRPGDPRHQCIPGEWGYRSEIPDDVKHPDVWVKCLNSPSWTRDNAGDPDSDPGPPRPDPEGFSKWLEKGVGRPGENDIVLFGLTLDCCVFCTAQELAFRGYRVCILSEGTDTRSGDQNEKKYLLNNPPLIYWASPINLAEMTDRYFQSF